MAEAVAQAPPQGVPSHQEEPISHRSFLGRFGTAIVLFIVFVALLALSWWLYPKRAVVDRPAPFGLTLISARGPEVGAFDVIPLTIAPDPPYSNPSKLSVTVTTRNSNIYTVQVKWTYTPALCPSGQNLGQSLGVGCAPTSPPYEVAGSLMNVSLPHGATILHCHRCQIGGDVKLPEHDSPVLPSLGVPDASVLATPPAFPVTATWTFEVHDTAFAWAANGLTAEASLPNCQFPEQWERRVRGRRRHISHSRRKWLRLEQWARSGSPDLERASQLRHNRDTGGWEQQQCRQQGHAGRSHCGHPARNGGWCPGRHHSRARSNGVGRSSGWTATPEGTPLSGPGHRWTVRRSSVCGEPQLGGLNGEPADRDNGTSRRTGRWVLANRSSVTRSPDTRRRLPNDLWGPSRMVASFLYNDHVLSRSAISGHESNISSLILKRLPSSLTTLEATGGTELRRLQNSRRERTSTFISVRATTVAVRGPPSIRASSPKNEPAPTFASSTLSRVIVAVPSTITKNSFPRSPRLMRTLLAVTSNSVVRAAICPSSLVVQDRNRST